MNRGHEATEQPPVRIDLIGIFRVRLGSRELVDRELGSRKGRLLLKLLVAERGHILATDRIVDVLWPSEPPAQPAANVAVLVSRLRSVLGSELIQGSRSGYLFRPGPSCVIDVDAAGDLAARARQSLSTGDLVAAGSAARAALLLLERGVVLEDEPLAEWADEARTTARRSLHAARQVACTVALEKGNLDEALDHAEHAVQADPFDEEAHRARMLALYQSGRSALAIQAFERFQSALEDELGAAPSHETEVLYRRVLRGDDLSMDVSRAASQAAGAPPFEAGGREEELRLLDAAWENAEAAGAGLALVSGEAGIGKSYLAAMFATRVERAGGLVLRAQCYRVEHSIFLQPIADALRPAILAGIPTEALDALAPELVTSLTDLLPDLRTLRPSSHERLTGDAAVERLRAFIALAALLEGLSRQSRILLVLDDLHAAGESTIEFVHWLLRRGAAIRCLVLGMVRSEDESSIEPLLELARRVPLGRLPPSAIATLAQRAGLGQMAEEVMDLTGGHPLYAVEMLQTIRETGGLRIPDSLRDTIGDRVRRAGEDVERFLRAGAVIGGAFDLELVGGLVEADQGRAVRLGESALRRGLLVAVDKRYEFAHEIVREVVYDTIPGPSRASWHRQVATILQRRGSSAEVVGYHAREAGDRALAARAFLAAARAAAAAFANREAERLAGQAVLAAAGLEDRALLAEASFERGKVRVTLEDHARAREDLAAALRLARAAGDRDLEIRTLEHLGWNAHFSRDLSGAAQFASEALAGAANSTNFALTARVKHAMGQLPEAENAATRALELGKEAGDLGGTGTALSYLGAVRAHMDRYASAISLLDEAETTSRDAGQLHAAMNALFFRGLALGNRGGLQQALGLFERLQRECSELEYEHHIARALNGLAWLWLELGDEGRTLELAARAAEMCASGPMDEPHANALLLQAEGRLRRNELEATSRLLVAARPMGLAASYAWRFELRVLELSTRLTAATEADTRPQALELAGLARARGAPKYEALGLAHAGRRRAAAAIARRLGSDLLLLKVAPPQEAAVAAGRIAGGLPTELRQRFGLKWPTASRLVNPSAPASAGAD
jgi:DNA-binding SARP family transcriptional activator